MKKQLLHFLVLICPVFASAQSTGFQSPTATAAPTGGWTNPTGAFASDDVYTTVPHQSGCRCPFLYLSWDNGVTYTSSQIVGPFGTTDNTMTAGSSSNTWGHAWTPAELSNANFRLKIANPSTLIEQGYADFNFTIPVGATITGIEVSVEEHGDSAYTTEYIDLIQVNVHYTVTTGVTENSFASAVRVFPNPASTTLTIDRLSPGTQSIRLYDMAGRIVLESGDVTGDRHTLSVGELPAGIYLLEIREERGVVIRKVVVE